MASKKENKSANKKEASFLAKTYIFLYNFAQVLGWSYLLFQIIFYYFNGGTSNSGLYDTVKWSVIIFQNAAILEIVHAATKLVPSNPIITTFQVFSRVMLVCGVLMPTTAGRESVGLPLCLSAWAFAEIIRYAYYALNIFDMLPYILIWLRYTAFYILYPWGVTGELLCLNAAQNEIAETNIWTIELPNIFNASFHYRHFLIFIILLYIPLFPRMYMHMIAQRKKVLGGESKIKQK